MPATDLVYFGTAIAEPWNPGVRNETAGDNLYTASIVAIRPDSGEYVWHFQETPWLGTSRPPRLREGALERGRELLAETSNGLYKTEGIHPNGRWRNVDEVELRP